MSIKVNAIAVGVLILAFYTGCERAKAPVNGIAGFELHKTTLSSVQPHSLSCTKQEKTTRCWINARQSILERVPQIELDFSGHAPESVLAEILLEVPGCKLDSLTAWFVDKLGKPTEERDNKVIWAQSHIYLAATVVPPARCHVIAVHPKDTERIAQLER